MGKSKAKIVSATNKCDCEDPYRCSCGKRPPRPSMGHKWYRDEQVWAGKGHKQKGASGQVASISKEAQITEKGKTKVEQWQRMPSQLLQEVCKRQKRPTPKFQNIEQKPNMFKVRVILPDPKEDVKDMFFVAAHSVSNEEQATEEGCLLALLFLTPNIPHERKLPEPYKTTWLNALALQKSKDLEFKSKGKLDVTSESSSMSSNKNASANEFDSGIAVRTTMSVAQASNNLQMANSYTSNASKRQQQEEIRKQRCARIRRHEAIRMANQDHPVFMSAQIRAQIEKLLRGEAVVDFDNRSSMDAEDELEDPVFADDDAKVYVEERLHNEGFTKRQARTAYKEFQQTNIKCPKYDNLAENEEEWDKVYEECLQWLLVHINEDQLPEGFDPRGRTLDVIVPMSHTDSSSRNESSRDKPDSHENLEHSDFASNHAISIREAILIADKAKQDNKSMIDAYWYILQKAAGISYIDKGVEENASEEMIEILDEETEALEAIYGSACMVKSENGLTSVLITIEECESLLTLEAVVRNGHYPIARPERLLLSGKWQSNFKNGAALQIQVLKFLSSRPSGEPLIFDVCEYVQDQLRSGELKEFSLLPFLGETKLSEESVTALTRNTITRDTSSGDNVSTKIKLRLKGARKTFWNVMPKDTPPARAFPVISNSLEKARKSLPAAGARNEFLEGMKKADSSCRVLLVTGETGSGKSTQLPAFLLENDPEGAKIVVAQPRRIAATGVASRVAEERGESRPGIDSVGFVVRGDSAMCDKTRLVFCTTGILLRQLQTENALDCITHIVIDEVHERGLDSDVLLGLLKQYLSSAPHLRVVLMSATLDTDRFAKYFDANTPHVHIPGRTFPVKDYTLKDVLSITGYVPRNKKKGINNSRSISYGKSSSSLNDSDKLDEGLDHNALPSIDASNSTANFSNSIEELINRIDETVVDYDMVACLVKHLVASKDTADDGSILIFLPGVQEINDALETIKRWTKDMALLLLPLHGGLQPKEQSKVFLKPQKGFTKVVLSTNVAETSVTIPDCTIVIDSAREKQSSYDPVNRMPLLVEQFASKASLQQRRGRAGRVRSGACYKLISNDSILELKDHSEPEIRRVVLDQILVQLLFLGVENGTGNFMNTLLDPPSKEALDAASFSLLKLGAVELGSREGELVLSPLGVHLAAIPAPPQVGKLLVMGSILGCRGMALAIAAGISLDRTPFLRIDKKVGAGNRRDKESGMQEMKHQQILDERASYMKIVGNSDHALLAAVFSKFISTDAVGGQRKRFCESVGVSLSVMRDMAQLAHQLDSALSMAGFPASVESDCNSKSFRIVHACLVASMSPSRLVRVQRPAAKYALTAEGAKAKDGEAKELKFFIRTDCSVDTVPFKEERVFIHPSSGNFSNGNYSCPFLVYNSLVKTSKPFLRDVTECSAYSLLLFGGKIEIEASKGLIIIDKWISLAANARIGSLMGGLRKKVDALLTQKVADPSVELATTSEMMLIVKLIKTDGLGT